MHSPQAVTNRTRFLAILSAVSATLGAVVPLQTTGAENDTLPLLRTAYLRAVAAATLEKEVDFASRLPELEQRLRERKDYLAARSVAEESASAASRVATLELLASAQQPAPGTTRSEPADPHEGTIVLEASAAITREPVHYDAKSNVVTGLANPGDELSWDLPDPLSPGGYEVILNHVAAERIGGDLRIEAGFHRLPCRIVATGANGELQRIAPGTLRVVEETSNITIVAETLPYENLIQLRSLELRPAAP